MICRPIQPANEAPLQGSCKFLVFLTRGRFSEDCVDIGEVDVDIAMDAIEVIGPAHQIEEMFILLHLLRGCRVDACHALEHTPQNLLAVQRILGFWFESRNVKNKRAARHPNQSVSLISFTAG